MHPYFCWHIGHLLMILQEIPLNMVFDQELKLPFEIMFGKLFFSRNQISTDEYIANLEHTLKETHEFVTKKLQIFTKN